MRHLKHLNGPAMLRHETVRFVITGSSVALLFYGLSYGLLSLGAPPFRATLVAYAVGFIVSYTVQQAWTFGGRQSHGRSFPRYLAAQLVAALTAAVVARASASLGGPPAVTALASTLSASALSYVLSRYWVFALKT